jgi:CDP-diacylglycerol--serine O-phosphatidyltransferase
MAVLQAGPAVQRILLNEWFLYGLIAGLCWLMVSNLPLMGLKFRDFGFRSNLPKWILAAVALASGLLLQWLAVPLVFAAYIALSLGFQSRRTS